MITPAQRAARKNGLGASDIFRLIYAPKDLWLEKTGRADGFDGSEATRWGDKFEPVILDAAGEELGCKVVRPAETFHADNGIMFANLDGMVNKVERGSPIVEAKNSQIEGDWGDPSNDGTGVGIPERVLFQVTAQMICSGSRIAYVARMLHKFGIHFTLSRVDFNSVLADAIEERAGEFWRKHVQADVMPELGEVSPDTAARILRRAGVSQIITEATYLDWSKARRARLDAEKAEEIACAKLLAEMMGADEARIGDGTLVATHFQSKDSERFDTEAFKAKHPDLWRAFLVTRPGSRRLLDKAAKKETARV